MLRNMSAERHVPIILHVEDDAADRASMQRMHRQHAAA